MGRRITMHNGRTGKDGVYNVKHNDRNFDVTHAEHINPDLIKYNYRWHCYGDKHPEWTFEQAEQQAYNQLFKKGLEARNQRYINGHHKDKCLTMDEYRTAKSSCPEETIMQIGRAGDSIEPELLKSVCSMHVNWLRKTYPNFRVLDVAMHVDEPNAAPHMHIRGVWVGHDKDGNKIVGQGKALEEMGIGRPDTTKPKSRYNNAKQTFTRQCREYLEELCRHRGIEVETERLEPSKTGLTLLEYKRQQELVKLDNIQQQLIDADNRIADAEAIEQLIIDAKQTLNANQRERLELFQLRQRIVDVNKALQDKGTSVDELLRQHRNNQKIKNRGIQHPEER